LHNLGLRLSKRQLQTAQFRLLVPSILMCKSRKAFIALALAGFALLGLSGCFSDQQDSSIPWSRPADWENTIPGMGK
jgi:hypothetical protein